MSALPGSAPEVPDSGVHPVLRHRSQPDFTRETGGKLLNLNEIRKMG